jgi:hypothetical protein
VRQGQSRGLHRGKLLVIGDGMSGKNSKTQEKRDALAEPRPVSRMSLSDRGRIVRALESLAGDYELERVEGKYRVTRDGQVLTSLHVCRCGDSVRLIVGGVPRS